MVLLALLNLNIQILLQALHLVVADDGLSDRSVRRLFDRLRLLVLHHEVRLDGLELGSR